MVTLSPSYNFKMYFSQMKLIHMETHKCSVCLIRITDLDQISTSSCSPASSQIRQCHLTIVKTQVTLAFSHSNALLYFFPLSPFHAWGTHSNYYHSYNIAISLFRANLYNYAELSEPPLDWYTVKTVINCTWLILLMKRYRQNLMICILTKIKGMLHFFKNFFILLIFLKKFLNYSIKVYKNGGLYWFTKI